MMRINAIFSEPANIAADFGAVVHIETGDGTDDYEKLERKPRINGVELIGNKTNEDINISSLSNIEIQSVLNT